MLPQARKPAPAAVDDPCVGCNDHTKSAKTAKARHAACLLEPFVSYRHRGTGRRHLHDVFRFAMYAVIGCMRSSCIPHSTVCLEKRRGCFAAVI
uniref:Secreted protein n=1 Tax=Ascaris lumbricoides TaxID=6252 RepID=A0A0M3HYU8_ASCLU